MRFLGKRLSLAYMALLGAIGMSAGIPPAMAAVSIDNSGDLAIVPYYNVRDNFTSGIHITNLSDEQTVAVKVRYRDAESSQEALDFIVVLSPNDQWVGSATVSDGSPDQGPAGTLVVTTRDTSCTVPEVMGRTPAPVAGDVGDEMGYLPSGMGAVPFPDFGLDGYIEVIGMGYIRINNSQGQYLANAARHTKAAGLVAMGSGELLNVPTDCAVVRQALGTATDDSDVPGVLDNDTTVIIIPGEGPQEVTWRDTANGTLKVSYLIRDGLAGVEMGDNATHIESFVTGASNALLSGQTTSDEQSYPNLDGGNPGNGGQTGRFDNRIQPDLGRDSIMNDWSYNETVAGATGVSTDWVVTFPGLYLGPNLSGPPVPPASDNAIPPHHVLANIYDREEDETGPQTSPQAIQDLHNEVNLIHWGPEPHGIFTTRENYALSNQAPFYIPLGGDQSQRIDPLLLGLDALPYGWARMQFLDGNNEAVEHVVLANTFWLRDIGIPGQNYARVIEHSYTRDGILPEESCQNPNPGGCPAP